MARGGSRCACREAKTYYKTNVPLACPRGAHTSSNLPLFSGEPDPGCILQFRVRLGVCRTVARHEPREDLSTWHDTAVPALQRSGTVEDAVEKAPREIHYNSAYSGPGRDCCAVHGENCPGTPSKGHPFQMGEQACSGRCRAGVRQCPRANCSFEEFCIFNAERIDQIEIIDGPSELVGFGRQLWDSGREARDAAVRAKHKEFTALEEEVVKEATEACEAAAAAMLKAAEALNKATALAPRRYALRMKARTARRVVADVNALCAPDDESTSESDDDSSSDDRDDLYSVGDEVEVYSKSSNRWHSGTVIGVDVAAGTVMVNYRSAGGALMQKVLMEDSADLRVSSGPQPAFGRGRGGGRGAQPSRTPPGSRPPKKAPPPLPLSPLLLLPVRRCSVVGTHVAGTFSKSTHCTLQCTWNGLTGESSHRYTGKSAAVRLRPCCIQRFHSLLF